MKIMLVTSCGLCFIMFNATFNNISIMFWQTILLVDEAGIPEENQRSVASLRQTLSHNVVSCTSHHERGSNSQCQW